MTKNIPKTLYHYTSLSGLEGILESQKLWMVNHKLQDDQTECTAFDEVINGYLKQEDDRLKLKYPLEKLFPKLKLLSSMGEHTIPLDDCGIYLTCFSHSFDNDTLWKDYADKYKGVVIAINTEKANITPINEAKIDSAFTHDTRDIVGMATCQKIDYLPEGELHPKIQDLLNFYYNQTKVSNIDGLPSGTGMMFSFNRKTGSSNNLSEEDLKDSLELLKDQQKILNCSEQINCPK